MRKALTGVSNNVSQNIDKIKVWAHSFMKHVPEGEVTLIAVDVTPEDIHALKSNGIKFHAIGSTPGVTINDSRLIHTANWINDSSCDLFMVTDVFDVCFQSDPFEMMDLEQYDFFAASEGVLHNQEPWNMDVARKAFSRYAEYLGPFEVICSGVMGGKKDAMIKVLTQMQKTVDVSPRLHDIRDQGALNVLIHYNLIKNCKIFKPNEGWAVHCSLSGPTFQHIEWGLGKIINEKYGLPKLYENVLLTHDNKPYAIAHQYNRIPEWNEKIIAQYV